MRPGQAALLKLAIGAAAILAAAGLVLLADADPVDSAIGLFEGAFGDEYSFAETIVRAVPIALGGLLFALFDSLALQAQSGSAALPVEFYSALPYAVTLLTLIATARAQYAPRSLGRPLET